MGQNVTGDNQELIDFLKWGATPEGQKWGQGYDPFTQVANVQPNWVPEGYTMYGDQKTGVTFPTGTNAIDAAYRGGMMSTIPGANPYFPNGVPSNGNLSLGGSPVETQTPPKPKQSTDKEFYEWLNTAAGKEWYDKTYGTPKTDAGGGHQYTQEEIDYLKWLNNSKGNLALGNKGVTGVAKEPAFDWSTIQAPLRGYESSSNKDFYQRQFQQQETQQTGQKLRELAAATRAQQAANAPEAAPKDPWAWANLPTVKMGGTVAATPIEWGLNPAYGIKSGMTNQQALNAISGVLTPEEKAIFSAQFTANPASATGTNWVSAGSPGALTNRSSDTALSPEFLAARAKVANNIYTQTGGGTGGITVPAGYANPINA